jgi:hypothetical protein
LEVLNAIGDKRGVTAVLRSVLDLCLTTIALLVPTLEDDVFWGGSDGSGTFSLGSWFGNEGGIS